MTFLTKSIINQTFCKSGCLRLKNMCNLNYLCKHTGVYSFFYTRDLANGHSNNARNLHTSCVNLEIKPSKENSLSIFDRSAKKQHRDRAAKCKDAHLYDYVKEEIGWRLADRVFDIKKVFKNAVDLGCSRGYVSRHLTPDSVEKITLCDTSQILLDEAKLPEGVEVSKMVLDEENFQFPASSLDLVISSLCLHWVNDLPTCFDNIMKALRSDGVFLATLFGEDTLYELRSSLQLADLERNGGIAPHVSPFTRIRDIGGLLNRSGFSLQTIDTDEIVVGYPSMFELMHDLQGMAENNSAFNRQLHLSRDTQVAAAAIYDELYGKIDPQTNKRSIPATFHVIYLLGWKPDKSQPQPLPRGSGQVSLKDLHKLDEISKKYGTIELESEDSGKK